eukprot:Skav228604  [mRNA]  locus=scaffold4464:57834:78326:- [translate_table: standard]
MVAKTALIVVNMGPVNFVRWCLFDAEMQLLIQGGAEDQSGDDELSANSSVTQIVEIPRESRKQTRAAFLADQLRRAGLVPCYDFPDSMAGATREGGGMEDYVHRIGRTGRAGRQGLAAARSISVLSRAPVVRRVPSPEVTFFPAPEDVSGTRSAGNAHEFIQLLRAAGQRVPPELLQLDTGPVTSSVAVRSKGKTPGEAGTVGKVLQLHLVAAEGSMEPQKPCCGKGKEKSTKSGKGKGKDEKIPAKSGGISIEGAGAEALQPIQSFKARTDRESQEAPFTKELRKKLRQSGFETPMPIQVVPTRELAAQIHREAERFAPANQREAWLSNVQWDLMEHHGTYGATTAVTEDSGAGTKGFGKPRIEERGLRCAALLAFLMARGGEAAAATAREIASCGASLLNMWEVAEWDRYTTLLKGHFAAADLASAWDIIEQMQAGAVCPDLRTLNTFLRGCVKLGALKDAEAVNLVATRDLGSCAFYARAKKMAWDLQPDAATYKPLSSAEGGRTLDGTDIDGIWSQVDSAQILADCQASHLKDA